jgi:hypothetical protein
MHGPPRESTGTACQFVFFVGTATLCWLRSALDGNRGLSGPLPEVFGASPLFLSSAFL